ncbi:MAG TPA: amylo-alpha-1,6-glucosidase [Phycisphaerales bacterium]
MPTLTIDLTLLSPEQRDAMLRREWFLTNGLGGFASGTVLGVPQRRYHNFLNAALRPPVGRVAGLSSVLEAVVLKPPGPAAAPGAGVRAIAEQRLEFTSFLFPGSGGGRAGEPAAGQVFAPGGQAHLERFEKDVTCRWFYRYGPVEFSRELALVRHENVCVLRYRVNAERHAARLELRPFTALRDFHELVKAHDRASEYSVLAGAGGCEVASRGSRARLAPGAGTVGGSFVQDRQWWYNICYRRDIERGQDGQEDLFSPGVFTFDLAPGRSHTIELVIGVDSEPAGSLRRPLRAATRDEIVAGESARLERVFAATARGLSERAMSSDERDVLAVLVQSADQFVVRRNRTPSGRAAGLPMSGGAAVETSAEAHDYSVIAGYPWFSDWGRDTMISLPGLLLTTGRLDEATRVMEAFAALTRRGLVPNCFDNGTGAAEYNTVDASLWYLHAAFNLHKACVEADHRDPTGEGWPIRRACLAIIDAYQSGTDFNIRADAKDGLIAAGETGTQLTWMDAKRDGVVFTPRHGKPVEINALWYSGLMVTADLCEKDLPRRSRELRQIAERVGKSFREQFWNDEDHCLYDVLSPRSGAFVGVDEIRPNQIFACSLPYSALEPERQQSVVKVVAEHLLTPRGLRTLSPTEKGYVARFEGPLFERDRAYHNGTVWPWLLGPYAEAVLRVGKFSERSRALARDAIQPLLNMISPSDGPDSGGPALGQIPEIYDADDSPQRPRRPDGCFAQAWSVAECLRVLAMTMKK